MPYELRHFDTPLLRFAVVENTAAPVLQILWLDEGQRQLLPLGLTPDAEGLARWLKGRAIPQNRAYVHSFLAKCGLSPNRPLDVIQLSKGLSLNDCYWVVEQGFEGRFADYNLYQNRFSRTLALIAFTGNGSGVRTTFASCPEFTTNGALPKCWRRQGGRVWLYKGGTSGAANTGFEPYSEYYAAQVAAALGIAAVDYRLARWQGLLCSVCLLFTDLDTGFVPVGRLVKAGGMQAVSAFYAGLGPVYQQALADMLVLDAVLCNTDRHFGNFGFLVDNRSDRIVAPAPLFDHGNALFSLAGQDAFASPQALAAYADTLQPCTYDGFIETAKPLLTARHREGLRRLLQFRFRRHARYNLPPQRLRLLEDQVHQRARLLLQ